MSQHLETDLAAVLFDHQGYCVTKAEGFFHIWSGSPYSEGAALLRMPISVGTAGVKHCIEAYELGCVYGGKRRSALIRKMLEKLL